MAFRGAAREGRAFAGLTKLREERQLQQNFFAHTDRREQTCQGQPKNGQPTLEYANARRTTEGNRHIRKADAEVRRGAQAGAARNSTRSRQQLSPLRAVSYFRERWKGRQDSRSRRQRIRRSQPL